MLDDRERKTSSEFTERRDGCWVAPGARGDDQRGLRRGEKSGGFVDSILVGTGRRGRDAARRTVVRETRDRCCQHFARQRQIDGALRLGRRHGESAVDYGFELLAVAQLVFPFDDLAQHAGLIEHLLRPVDVNVARTGERALSQWRPAGGKQDRHILAGGVERAAYAIGGADADMHHDRRHAPGNHGVTMRHG